MFFAALFVIPVLAGLLLGTFGAGRKIVLAAGAACIGLGLAGAGVILADPDTTDRASSTAFGVAAGIGAAVLVVGSWAAARAASARGREA